jgi:ATP-dependent helicase/nuclease subunit A
VARVDLTGEQRDAVYTAGNVLVRAGAGSGKTEVLAQRFVALLAGDIVGREPLAPERIAAITFTEKATADMRRRIAEVLDDRIAREADAARRTALVRARRTLGLARISTIHAFCARMLREYPIEAGVDPGFEVLDEYQSMTFLESACRELIADAVRRQDLGAMRLVGARGLYGFTHQNGAIGVVLQIVGEAARLGRPHDWIRASAETTAAKLRVFGAEIPALRSKLIELVSKLLAIRGIGGNAKQDLDALRVTWPGLRSALEKFGADSEPSDLEAVSALEDELPEKRNQTIKGVLVEIDDVIENLRQSYGAHRAAPATLEIATLVADIAAELDRRKREERLVTFDDLLILAKRLLHEHPEVALRYRRTLGALLVDEYQDTDPIQDGVVRLLTENGAPAPELFVVGDEKQSIYRFRGADVTVFNRSREPLAILARPLCENRRSLPAIVDFVNAVSAHSMQPDDDPDDQPYKVKWSEEHRLKAIRPSGDVPAVELIVRASPQDSDEAKRSTRAARRIEADAIARHCARMIGEPVHVIDTHTGAARPAQFGDIALLLRSFSDVAIYEDAFARARVPSYTVKGRGFYDCKEVKDLAALLGAIDDAQNPIELAAALRSPMFGLSDQCLLEIALHLHEQRAALGRAGKLWELFDDSDEDFAWLGVERDAALNAKNVLIALRKMRERASLTAIVERALELTRFEAVMLGLPGGLQRAANVRKLMETAREFETHHFFGLGDFVRHLRRLVQEEPREPQAQIAGEADNVVRLMTIHQAKGLEFPIVIVADLGRRPHSDNESIVMTPEHGLLVCDTVGAGNDRLPNPLVDTYRAAVKDQEQAEAARVLYVAMTRARDRLILSEGAMSAEWVKHVRAAIGLERVQGFVDASDAAKIVNAGRIEIVLRRADALAREAGAPPAPGVSAPLAELAETARARLGFIAPPVSELVTSPSALEDFERCSRQYFLRHEIELPEGEGGLGGGGFTAIADGGGATAMGTVAHAVLEQLTSVATAPGLEAEITRLVSIHCAGANLDAASRRALVRDLLRYASSRENRQTADAGASPVVHRETPFFMSIEGDGLTLFIRGRIDLLVDYGNRLTVSDYKYARAGAADYQVQMACYALAAAEAVPGREVSAEIVYLRERVERRPLKLAPLHALRAHLLALGRGIAAARAVRGQAGYPKRPADARECRALGCGYVTRCWPRDGQSRAT